MTNHHHSGDQRLLWLTDPHLEKAPPSIRDKLIKSLEGSDYEMAVITGDIATSATLPKILPILAETCGRRRLFVILGNHDFAGADVSETLSAVDGICRRHANLTHLTTRAPVRITDHTTLVGHHGLSGFRRRKSQDAKESREKFLHGIFSARGSKTQLLAATHYPPFCTSARYNGRPCPANMQAFFTNHGLGYMLIKMAKRFTLPVRVIAGHTHHPADDAILRNLSCRVGGAGPGHTGVQGILMV